MVRVILFLATSYKKILKEIPDHINTCWVLQSAEFIGLSKVTNIEKKFITSNSSFVQTARLNGNFRKV